MADTTRAKNHLQTTLSTLENTTTWWVRKIEETVTHTAFQLSMNLSNDNFFVDNDTLNTLTKIRDYMINTWDTGLNKKLENEESWLPTWTPAQVVNAYSSLRRGAWFTNIWNRVNECNEIITRAWHINLDASLNDVSCVLWAAWTVSLDLSGMTTGTSPDSYRLCDKNWKEYRYFTTPGWNYFQVEIWWRNVKMYWVTIDPINHRIDFSGVRFDPTDVDTSNPLEFSVNAVYGPITTAWNIKVISNKPFNLKLSNSVAVDETWRRNVIQSYETTSATTPAWGVIITHLDNTCHSQRNKLLRGSIERLINRTWSPVFGSLSNEQKDEFLKRMLDPARTTIPWISATWLGTDLDSFVDFNRFRDWFAHNDRAWNKDSKITKSDTVYTQYVHDHFRSETENYFNWQLDHLLQADPTTETFLKAQLSQYIVEIDTNWRDNPVIRDNVEHIFTEDEVQMKKNKTIGKWWKVWQLEPIRKKDNNYMRFFSWASKEIKNQNVNLSSGAIKYDMKVDVNETNKLWVEIKIDWQEPITLQSWDYDPATLARRILREPSISTNKVRVHIVYNLYKSLLQLAKEKNIKLEYFENRAPWYMHEVTIWSNWNIVLNTTEYGTTPPYTKTSTVLFNEQIFQNTNKYDSTHANDSLEEWIYSIASHFSYAMNRIHDNYRKSIKRSIRRWLQRWWKTNLPTSFWTSPIRKIMNIKNVTKFDFSTSTGNAQIELKWNTFTVTTPDSSKPIVSKSLWKILNTRINKRRIFDWKERDIVEAVYSNLIKKMRENSKIARTNFWVVDELTGHVYVLDSTGHFGRINRDTLNWTNIIHRFWGAKVNEWVISNKKLMGTTTHPWYAYHRLTADEEKELLKNPLLMQWFVKAMNRRMWVVESVRAWFDRN